MMKDHQPLDPQQKMDIEAILEDLENYRPIRKGWTWRKVLDDGIQMGPFHFHNMSEPLEEQHWTARFKVL
jgi:D-ornithine 4,5-aminomutase subunit beta